MVQYLIAILYYIISSVLLHSVITMLLHSGTLARGSLVIVLGLGPLVSWGILDRLARSQVVCSGVLGWAFANLALAYSESLLMISAFRAFNGLCLGMVLPVVQSQHLVRYTVGLKRLELGSIGHSDWISFCFRCRVRG